MEVKRSRYLGNISKVDFVVTDGQYLSIPGRGIRFICCVEHTDLL